MRRQVIHLMIVFWAAFLAFRYVRLPIMWTLSIVAILLLCFYVLPVWIQEGENIIRINRNAYVPTWMLILMAMIFMGMQIRSRLLFERLGPGAEGGTGLLFVIAPWTGSIGLLSLGWIILKQRKKVN